MSEETGGRIIGIDLGTTFSVGAVLDESLAEPIVIPTAVGSNKTPSIVAFTEEGDVLVGEIARRQIATNPSCTITTVKRLMGRYYSDVEGGDEHYPFELVHEDDQLLINVRGIGYTPQQISSLILKKIKEEAEDYLGEPVDRAIVTVPANFDDLQREATIEAGRLAGLTVERLVNEPTAAAMAYGLGKEEEEVVAVYDFGGGTFDISLLEVSRNAFEVLTTMGDSHLGGEDIDEAIVEVLAQEFKEQHDADLLADPLTARRIKEAAEKAKCELSTAEQTMISVPFAAYKDKVPLHLERRFTRAEFEDLVHPIVTRTLDCCREAMRHAGLSKTRIDKVILVGGSSRIPLVQDGVAEFFDIEPFKGVNPDEIVALGAATQGGVMAGHLEEVVLLEVTPHSLGVEVKSNRVSRIIEKNSTIPIKAAKTFTTTEANQEVVNIHVLQGEETEAGHNRSLGRFSLSGIEPSPAGMPRIRVVFFINSDGVVEISATNLHSGEEKSLTVVHSFLTDEQYRASRRAASREARRKRRRPAAARKLSDSDLKGRVLESEKNGRTREPDESPGAVSEAEPAGQVESDPGFMEIAADGADSPAQVLSTEEPSASRGARVAQSVQRPPSLTTPVPSDTGEFAPSTESITEQLDELHEEVEKRKRKAKPELPEGQTPATVVTAKEDGPARDKAREAVAQAAEEAVGKEKASAKEELAEAEALRFADLLSALDKDFPKSVAEAVELLDEQKSDEKSIGVYQKAVDDVARLCETNPKVPVLDAVSAALQVYLRDPEAATKSISKFQGAHRGERDLAVALYSRLIDRYPQYVPALRARGRIYKEEEDVDRAIADFEAAIARETSDEETLELLEQMYRIKLETAPTPALEFKMVKLFLKMSRLDDAISILQRLVNNSSYEQRALKILGLCFWQKNMYYLAWQKFKQLPVTDDLKDILYRVASDMEGADQLINAKYALERILETDIGYKDVEARLKRINHRLRMQQEELAQTKIPASAEVLQDSRFVILDEINRGSMGVVYRARDKVLDEIVAIKVLNDYLCADPQAVQRFKREARAAKRLSHPNIVRIHEFYESGGKKFISMEYIEGCDLKKLLIEEGKIELSRLREIFSQMCAALQYAHELDIVHRDIKPANVMIPPQGGIKVTDFGIAKILRTEDVTRSGSLIMGTPLYMAPEQIEGGAIDGRSDMYSLGVMLYECVAGHPPFTEGNIEYHHVHTPVPELPEAIPDELKQIVYKCVEKKAGERYQTAGELLKDLEALPD